MRRKNENKIKLVREENFPRHKSSKLTLRCLAKELESLKALLHSGCSHLCGLSPVLLIKLKLIKRENKSISSSTQKTTKKK